MRAFLWAKPTIIPLAFHRALIRSALVTGSGRNVPDAFVNWNCLAHAAHRDKLTREETAIKFKLFILTVATRFSLATISSKLLSMFAFFSSIFSLAALCPASICVARSAT